MKFSGPPERICPQRRVFFILFVFAAAWISAAVSGAFASGICPPDTTTLLDSEETGPESSGPSWSAYPSGFLDLQFVHDVVVADNSIYHRTLMISPDSLGACIQHLQDYGTRNSHSAQIIAAGRWLKDRLVGLGYVNAYIEPIDFGGGGAGTVGNVVASRAGSARPEYRIIVGGHYDSFASGGGPVGGAPGADDNASGTAATLEIARLLSKVDLDATIQYVLFAGEEQGLHGSQGFVEGLLGAGVEKERVFFINMDMIGYVLHLPWRVNIGYGHITRPLAELMAGITNAYTTLVPQMALGVGGSDHVPFGRNGYPAVFINEGVSNPYWHTSEDLLANINMDYETEVVRTVMATVLHLGRLAPPPENIVATETETGDVMVEWSHSPDADVTGYQIEVLAPAGQGADTVFTRDDFVLLSPEIIGEGAWLRIRSADVLGTGEASESIFLGKGGAIASIAKPNPASGTVYLEIFLPGTGPAVDAEVKIVDASGRLVYSVHDDLMDRGANTLRWNGASKDGELVPSGVYFYIIEADGPGRDGGRIMMVR